MSLDIEKARREATRWHVLTTLHLSQPQGCTDVFLQSVLRTVYPDTTVQEVRRQLDYLQDRELIELSEQHTGTWVAKIGRHGVDVVEYTVAVEPGIARPQRV